LNLSSSKIEDLGSLEVCGDLYLHETKTLKSLGKLKKVVALDLTNSNIMSLGNLEQISGTLYLNKHIQDFGKVQEFDGIVFNDSKIKSLGNIKKIHYYMDLRDTMIEDLGDLEETKGNLVLNSKIKSLGKLKRVGGMLDIPEDSKIQSLDNLEYVGGLLDIEAKSIKTLGNLKEVKGSIYLNETNIEDLGSLVHVEDNLYLRSCKKLKTLGKLNKVGGKLELVECKNLESLGDLEYCQEISGIYDCKKITTLGKLKEVNYLDLMGTKVASLDGIKYINSLSIDTPIDLSTIPSIQELTINLMGTQKKNFKNIRLNKIYELNLFNVSLESLYVNEVTNLNLESSEIKTLSNAKGLDKINLVIDSIIQNFDNVNLKNVSFSLRGFSSTSLANKTRALMQKAREEYIKQVEILNANIEKYNMLINNMKSLLDKPEISTEDKKEIREAIEVYEDRKREVSKDVENRFEYGGQLFNNELYAKGGLIAPNGKKSNLTPEQYKLVRTPQFKAWFGDWENDPKNASKVVDENGEPLVVYHGTMSKKFNKFDNDKTRFGYFYFAVNQKYAEAFGKTRTFFINARKIKDATQFGIRKISEDTANKLFGIKEKTYRNDKYKFWQFFRVSNDIENVLKWNNYDAVKFEEDYTDDDDLKLTTIAYAVLNPKNIKLADGSNTTFDVNKLDIRYDSGGKLFNNGGNMKKVDSGGITYGASHDNGGIPVKNASTGEMLEVEGGEGIVNKRSMASDKMVKLNGKQMTICEAVSQLNQMEGGVKFSCDDVEHRQFIEEMENGGELERGERTELEHIQVLKDLYARRLTPKQATKQIAKDHLKENPNYYTELRRIEKMANGGKSSCGCSHHTTKFNYGGTTNCGCNSKKYENGGELSDTDRMIQRLLELKKPKDEKQDLIDTTLLEARRMLDVDYKENLQNLPPEIFSLIKNIPSFNLYNLGWRCHYTTHKTIAGVCVNDDYDENQISLKKHHIYLSIDFVRNEKNWSSRYKDVILHEIAHGIVTAFFIEPMGFGNFIAIDPLHGETQGHGLIWKAVCGVLNPEGNCDQFFKDAIFEEQHKNYVYKCVNCGNKKYGNSPTFAKICNKCFKSIFVEKNNE